MITNLKKSTSLRLIGSCTTTSRNWRKRRTGAQSDNPNLKRYSTAKGLSSDLLGINKPHILSASGSFKMVFKAFHELPLEKRLKNYLSS